MRKFKVGVLTVIAGAVGALGGCGGGGDGSSGSPGGSDVAAGAVPTAAKQVDFASYAGTWSVCNSYRADYSTRYKVTITQAGAGGFHYEWRETDHGDAQCSDSGELTYQEQGDVTALGETVTVDGIEAQKVHATGQRTSPAGTGTETFSETQVVALTAAGVQSGGPVDVDPDGTMHFQPYALTSPEAVLYPAPPPPPPPPAVAPPPPPVYVPPEPSAPSAQSMPAAPAPAA